MPPSFLQDRGTFVTQYPLTTSFHIEDMSAYPLSALFHIETIFEFSDKRTGPLCHAKNATKSPFHVFYAIMILG